MTKVLVAVDGEEQAGAAARFLIEHARRTSGGELIIARIDSDTGAARRGSHMRTKSFSEESHTGSRLSETAGPWLENSGIQYEIRTMSGDVADVVARLSDQEECDEIVFISRPAGPLGFTIERLIGLRPWTSIDRIVAHSKIPVTVVSSDTLTAANSAQAANAG